MSAFVTTDWRGRWAAIEHGPLALLADSLAADLDRLLPDEDVFVPAEKAVLTRHGGRCDNDGTLLDFDPRSPRNHSCPACGASYSREEDYRWWIMGYQLWVTERAVHAALLARLRGHERHRRLAAAILLGLAERYAAYPNEDNVLGPGRVFFSTYLESIWLLQLGVALSLLDDLEVTDVGGTVRDRIVEPSARLIAQFNEAGSNRQVWNSAALALAGRLLDRPALVDAALGGAGGLTDHLESGLLADGTWYEGENYHLFAHRGLWYLVSLADEVGFAIPEPLRSRFRHGFVTPLLTALPDFTFPSRRDSQYAVSLRQWRFAESLELGLAERPDDQPLAVGLRQAYAEAAVALPDRWRSTGEAERNVTGRRLTRADLGWKTLWFGLPELPEAGVGVLPSVLLRHQGYGVVRRDDGRVYVALDYGHSGGGHGHPDRLNLWLVANDARILEDVGTGSYVEASLHWYRSTLAHNAPMVNGARQWPVDGVLRAWDSRGAFRWVDAEAELAPAVRVRRSVVVGPDYLVDRVSWDAEVDLSLDLPLHVDAQPSGVNWEAATWQAAEPDDGFGFTRDAHRARLPGVASIAGNGARTWIGGSSVLEWWRFIAPGPPGHAERRFLLARGRGRSGHITSVWTWGGSLEHASVDHEAIQVHLAGGITHRHRVSGDEWVIDGLSAGPIVLSGIEASASSSMAAAAPRPRPAQVLSTVERAPAAPGLLTGRRIAAGRGQSVRFKLGARQYRRSEQAWSEAGRPTATVVLASTPGELLIEVSIDKQGLSFASAVKENPLDNEHPDVNSDGVQLLVASSRARGTWLLVPEPAGERVRVTPGNQQLPLSASWRLTPRGYQVLARVGLSALADGSTIDLDIGVIVNEKPGGRVRRRGQLVLGARRSGWVYLRGDRHDPADLLRIRIARA